jgi:hypothetical protein
MTGGGFLNSDFRSLALGTGLGMTKSESPKH